MVGSDDGERKGVVSKFLKRIIAAALLLPALAWGAADPQVASVVDTPDPVPAGGVVTYTVQVDNNDNQTGRSVELTFSMPAGASFVSAESAAAICTLTTPTLVTCTLGSVGPLGNDRRTLTFKWRATGPGPDTLNATISLTASNDANLTNNTQTAQTTVVSGANLVLTKTGSPSTVVGGANVTYTLTASNPAGPNDSGDLVLVDTLPPAVSLVSAAGTGWNCASSGQTLTCTRPGPHAIGVAIPPVIVVGKVNASGGAITNVATLSPAATGGVPDPDTGDNTATVNTLVTPGADVRINQKVVISSLPATAGEDVSFRIEPRNDGPVAATNVQVDDTLPAGWTLVSATGPNWTCAPVAGNPRCTRASLPVGATDDITVVATAPSNAVVPASGQTYTNTANISSATPDPTPDNNTGAANVLVIRDGADLRVAKTQTPNPVAQGSPLVSLLTVSNNGPRRATGPLQVVDQLTGATFVSASGTGWSCNAAGATVTCTHANAGGLAVNDSLPTLTITSTATAANAQAGNTACASTTQPPVEGDPNAGNDCATASSLSTTVQPDLAIAKTTLTANADTTVDTNESSVTYRLVVSNASLSAQNATGIVIRDTVPAFIGGRSSVNPVGSVTSTGGVGFNCSVSGADITCTQSGGSFAQGDSVIIPITVNRPLQDGSFTNTATVSNTAEGDPNPNNNSASANVTILPIADVEVSAKTVTPASIRAGETATYVVSYRNNGPSTASNVVLTDTFTLPAGDPGLLVTSISSTKPGSNCTLTAGTTLKSGGTQGYTCTVGSLANGETQSVTLRVRPLFISGNAGGRVFGNTASINTSTVESPTGGDNGNNSKTATLTVTPSQIDVLVNKTDAVDPVGFDPTGQTFIDYRVRVTSNGPSYGSAVSINETMTPPAGRRVRFVCDTTGFGSASCNAVPLCSGRNTTSLAGVALATFSCQVPPGDATTGAATGDLAASQSKDLFLRFEVLDGPAPTGDVYRNEAVAVSGNEPDNLPGNNSQIEPTTVRERIDLRTSKVATVASPGLNEPFEWVITVANRGPGTSRQTDLTDVLPAGVQATAAPSWTRVAPAGSGSCTQTGQTLSCALGQLDSGGSATVRVPVRITSYPSGGSLTNTATVDNDPAKTGGVDTPGGNNVATSTVNVQRASLSGTVFEDRVRDASNGGTPQAAGQEPRIAGVTVTLTGQDAYGNALTLTATTDASGAYSFPSLPASGSGGYTVTETQPATHANGPVAVPASGAGAPSQGGSYTAGALRGNSVYGGVVLGATTVATQYNFPEQLLPAAPSLSGVVYFDRDGNGQYEAATDPGIPGAPVRLLNAATGALVATATTDGSGAYRFTGLDPSVRYTLEEPLPTNPAGLVQGGVNPGLVGSLACASGCTASPNGGGAGVDRITDIDLSSGTDGTFFNFGERQEGVISGTVYLDRNRSGALDAAPTDGRISGVTLTLYPGSSCTGTPLATVQTDASGNYAFPPQLALRPYTVCETQPSGHADGSVNPGAGGAALAGGNAITIASLPATGSPANLFGERLGSVSGTVFLDPDNNGLQAPAEPGIAGTAITLNGVDASGQAVTRSTTADTSGAYRFDDLPLGTYAVTEPTQPAGTGNGITTAGSTGGTATPPATLPSSISGLPITAGALDSSGNNFAEVPANSVIAGRVWLDRNNDGVIDSAETGIAGITVELSGTDLAGRAITRTTTTDADGRYQFTALPPGTYTVREPDQPAGTLNGRTVAGSGGGTATAPGTQPSAIAGIVVAVGGQALDNNFGELPPGLISGRVWADNDDDGRIGATESGLPGVALVLTGTDDLGQPVNRSTTAVADGSYAFNDLRPGSYTLTEPTQPTGTVNGKTVAGSLGGTVTPAATQPSSIGGVVLPPGGQSLDNNFGELSQSPDLRVTKTHAPATFTVNQNVGYTIRVRNAGDAPIVGVYTVRDRLPAGIALSAAPSGSGWACDGKAGDTAFACTASAVIGAGAAAASPIEVPVRVSAQAAAQSPVQNAVLVEGGGEIPARGPQDAERAAFGGDVNALPVCSAAIAHNACREPVAVQLAAAISGTVWKDIGSQPQRLDGGDAVLPNWRVEVIDTATGNVVAQTTTGPDGRYRIVDLVPGVPLAVRFRDPASNVVFGYPVNGETAAGSSGASCATGTPVAGQASSCVERGADPRLVVTLAPGQELPQQSLPVDPSGVVYDSGTRVPVGGSVVTLAPVSACPAFDPARDLVGATLGGYRINGSAVSMTVGSDGFYQFLFSPSAPASCTFRLSVVPPAGYQFVSTAIPPTTGPLTPSGGPTTTFLVQPQAAPPTADPGSTGTRYYLDITGGSAVANIIHNHLPLDPALPTGLALSKTGDRAQAEVGDSVRYTITVRVTAGALPRQTTVVDRLPLGFTYIPGTATVDDKPVADALTNPPGGRGPLLAFNLGPMPANGQLTLRYRVRVGVGSTAGDGINRARAHACGRPAGCVDASLTPLAGSAASNEGQHRVKVSGGVFAPEACVAGKVFVDCNNNHVQDPEELGIPGVRLVLEDGTTLISDSEGKYSHCGLTPQSHVLRVDPVTLPQGSRLTTSSNRNLGDAGSLWLDLRNGELQRADFIEGACSSRVIEQVKARRSQGEVRAPERERAKGPPLRFESKPAGAPRQATDGARQPLPTPPRAASAPSRTEGGLDANR